MFNNEVVENFCATIRVGILVYCQILPLNSYIYLKLYILQKSPIRPIICLLQIQVDSHICFSSSHNSNSMKNLFGHHDIIRALIRIESKLMCCFSLDVFHGNLVNNITQTNRFELFHICRIVYTSCFSLIFSTKYEFRTILLT